MLTQQHILKRQSIREELKKVFNYPLTVIVAAMGYGKTITVMDFLKEINIDYIWLFIENDETSPQYIWDSFTRQLTRVNPDIGKKLNELGFPNDAPQRNRIFNLIQEYAYENNFLLVIDDYHFAHSKEMDKFIELLVRSDIKGFNIIIITRTRPDINIEELKLKEYCYLIKSNLFELTEEEIKEYFKLYDINISKDMVRNVYELSEGWISAVYLLMQRYIRAGKLKPGENIERLIEKGIMSRYTAIEKSILVSLSILDSFTSKQAVYVSNYREAEDIIQSLRRDNSFIRYDEQNEVYRIHNIFNNYLKKLLYRQFSDIEIRDIYRRSGKWYINNGDIIAGLKYLLKVKEYALILNEFEKESITKVIDNNPKFILELFQNIPDEIKYKYPIGYINYASFYVTNVDRVGGKCLLSSIEQYYKDDNNTPQAVKNRVFGEIELIRSFTEFNDAEKMHQGHLKAYRLLDGNSVIANKDKICTYGCPHILYTYYREKKKMLWLVEFLEKIYCYYEELSNGCGAGFEYQVRAEYSLETGDFQEAEIYVYKAIYKAKTMKQIDIIICASFTLARLRGAQGKFNEAVELMRNLYVEVEAYNSPILNSAYELCMGYIGGIINSDESFAQWLMAGNIEQSQVLYQGMGFNYIVYSRWVLLEKNYIKLDVLCEEMMGIFSKFNNLIGFVHTYILSSIAKYRIYDMNRAKNTMKAALEIGRKDNIIIPFAEYSLYIKDILEELQRETTDDEYLEKLVKYTSKYYSNLKNFENINFGILSLTNREKEILQLIVEGKTNKEIASKLFIAQVTVKKNITAIYGKLKVRSRASAVRKAIELKIV
ncbi:LuxR C-terminal-related transcriptional regulator [Maledivibacter halophilus]|uniref:LuxR family transcriptional regulator, maltose regulon positive regulatory protein n=1 Tax=Maledivibacter halophilus TaxID=36842 RepID=A0A1T5M982_9FIRM|nr:LuxR C-terminal-related transcriptional regulator [Maledivibacter halophilus]SKC84388.1 LuxR family transcriptional regulator, maltose regulon positive regulatory protein [Maledivibacter halophilus]